MFKFQNGTLRHGRGKAPRTIHYREVDTTHTPMLSFSLFFTVAWIQALTPRENPSVQTQNLTNTQLSPRIKYKEESREKPKCKMLIMNPEYNDALYKPLD